MVRKLGKETSSVGIVPSIFVRYKVKLNSLVHRLIVDGNVDEMFVCTSSLGDGVVRESRRNGSGRRTMTLDLSSAPLGLEWTRR
jgi:hypothetical protein